MMYNDLLPDRIQELFLINAARHHELNTAVRADAVVGR